MNKILTKVISGDLVCASDGVKNKYFLCLGKKKESCYVDVTCKGRGKLFLPLSIKSTKDSTLEKKICSEVKKYIKSGKKKDSYRIPAGFEIEYIVFENTALTQHCVAVVREYINNTGVNN